MKVLYRLRVWVHLIATRIPNERDVGKPRSSLSLKMERWERQARRPDRKPDENEQGKGKIAAAQGRKVSVIRRKHVSARLILGF